MAPDPAPLSPIPPLPVAPQPGATARERALGAALARFAAVHGAGREIHQDIGQGSGGLPRPMKRNASSEKPVMVRTRLAIATVAVALAAAPIAWQVAQDRGAQEREAGPAAIPEPGPTGPVPPAAPGTAQGEASGSATRPQALDEPAAAAPSPAPPIAPVAPEAARAKAAAAMAQRGPDAAARQRAVVEAPVKPSPRTRALGEASRTAAAPAPALAMTGTGFGDAPPPARRMTPAEPGSPPEPSGRDVFAGAAQSGFHAAKEQPVSTFSIDVDTAAYGFVRAALNRNVLPPRDAVRTEEMINYFPYADSGPASAAEPFRIHTAVFPSPWAADRRIVRIGIKGYALRPVERPAANLVFLIDISGSMDAPNRLPLVKQALAMLLTRLDGRDRVAIVTYAGEAGTALEPTPASDTQRILAVLDGLRAGGGTAGGEGIRQAYALAARNIDPHGVNRVVLATDGDFNVGITGRDDLTGFVARERGKGIFLSVLGFGMGNYNDALMQALAQNGNGAAAYIDTLNEARKVLVEEATATLIPIARDVKVQVEFNPAAVAEYRLIGYETRALAREDFSNDAVDAGEVGSGQGVTALYEIVPAGGPTMLGTLRYGAKPDAAKPAMPEAAPELAHVAIRYKLPDADASRLIEVAIGRAAEAPSFEAAPQEARFATAVAGFAEILRGAKYTGRFSLDDVLRIGLAARGEDPFGYRAEFLQLVRAAKTAKALAPLRP